MRKRKYLLEETNSLNYFKADYIPGLIIDKFDKYIFNLNLGVEVFKDDVINAIKKYLKPKGI